MHESPASGLLSGLVQVDWYKQSKHNACEAVIE